MSHTSITTKPGKLSGGNKYFSKLHVRITLFILGTLLGALLLNMALSTLALEKIYTKSLLLEYSVLGRYHVQKIERALGFGKALSKFTGLPELFTDFHFKHPEIKEIFVYSSKNEPIYSLKEKPDQEAKVFLGDPLGEEESVVLKDDSYHLTFPIHGGNRHKKTLQGYAEIVLPEALIEEKLYEMLASNGKLLVLIAVSSALFLFLLVKFVIPTRGSRKSLKRFSLKSRALVITSLVLILSQVGFSYLSLSDFKTRYFSEIQAKCYSLGSLIKNDVDYLLGLGISIEKLIKIDTLLGQVLQNIPELSDIAIIDTEGKALYRAVVDDENIRNKLKEVIADPENLEPSPTQIALPLESKKATAGYVHMSISSKVIDNTIGDLLLDSITVVVVSLLVGFEFVFFLVALLLAGEQSEQSRKTASVQKTVSDLAVPTWAAIRTSAFLFAFAMALSMSFLPIYADQLYQPMAGLSREVIIGLPISAEMLCVAISLALCGTWVDYRGWLYPFILGVVITGAGTFFCGLAGTIYELLAARGCVGFGYGMALMATQSVIVNQSRAENRSRAVAGLEAGYFSGFISSTAVGGMLAEKIGYQGVFFVGSLLVLLSIMFVVLFLRKTKEAGKLPREARGQKEDSIGLYSGTYHLFKDRIFMGSLLLSAIPSALCLVGFLYFASPLLLDDLGVKQSNIARLMMPYGLCMVYVAPFINHWVDRFDNKLIPVTIGGGLGGVALISYFFLNSVVLYVVVLVLFALSCGLSYGARIATISNSLAVKRVGRGKALGIFNSLERVGNMAGPVVVGGMIATFGLASAISNLGAIYLIATVLFFIVARKTAAS
ncbi:MAG: hypothetical protein C0614_07460 [Desulfuromonas sp.]|nr:MAG: hypothetical protein C0614_07460 [Desulfuromonas sp.]